MWLWSLVPLYIHWQGSSYMLFIGQNTPSNREHMAALFAGTWSHTINTFHHGLVVELQSDFSS